MWFFFGVIHALKDVNAVIREMHRVLKTKGFLSVQKSRWSEKRLVDTITKNKLFSKFILMTLLKEGPLNSKELEERTLSSSITSTDLGICYTRQYRRNSSAFCHGLAIDHKRATLQR